MMRNLLRNLTRSMAQIRPPAEPAEPAEPFPTHFLGIVKYKNEMNKSDIGCFRRFRLSEHLPFPAKCLGKGSAGSALRPRPSRQSKATARNQTFDFLSAWDTRRSLCGDAPNNRRPPRKESLDASEFWQYVVCMCCTASAGCTPTVTASRGASEKQTGSFADPFPLQSTVPS